MKTMIEKFTELKKNLELKVEKLEQEKVEVPEKIKKDITPVLLEH